MIADCKRDLSSRTLAPFVICTPHSLVCQILYSVVAWIHLCTPKPSAGRKPLLGTIGKQIRATPLCCIKGPAFFSCRLQLSSSKGGPRRALCYHGCCMPNTFVIFNAAALLWIVHKNWNPSSPGLDCFVSANTYCALCSSTPITGSQGGERRGGGVL